MKKILLIVQVFVFSIMIYARPLTNCADTLINKGINNYDTLKVAHLDSLVINDSTKNRVTNVPNIFIPFIELSAKNNYHERIKKNNFSKDDYRNLSDVFTYEPFSFNQDLGSLGQPNEQMFYGLGFGNVSYISDGVLINNRWQNSYNLNRYSNELVDSIEIIPITKGFLYSTYNNPVAVSINSRFNYPMRAITKLRFFQASYDEGFVDVIFHSPITKKLNVGLNISNTAIDSRFANSDYESWKLNAQINYQLSDKMNIDFSYHYSNDTLALFGGLDTNKMLNGNYSTVLYETINKKSARYLLNNNNQANLKILAFVIPNIKSDLSFYFISTSQKYFQNEGQLFENIPRIVHGNYYQTFGMSFRNLYEQKYISFDVIANYETSTFKTDVLNNNSKQDVFTFSGELKYLTNSDRFIPAVYGKLNRFNGKMIYGFGFEVMGKIDNHISYYLGMSLFQQQTTHMENNYLYHSTFPYDLTAVSPPQISENRAAEVGIKFDYNFVSGKITYFNYKSLNKAVPIGFMTKNDSLLVNEVSFFSERNIYNSGINLNFNFVLWKLLFNNNLSYYFSSKTERVYASPDYTLAGKIYYTNFLFENNLYLKTGINYRLTAGQLPFVYDFEKSLQITANLTPMVNYSEVPSSFQLDLFMSGTIQERATIFVTIENVLDAEYYIVPYYFKQPMTLRFGVSWLLYD
ncbi:MAG: hypothetical protein COW71_08390 [Ignavibacteriales bacterium CG18_big_fil_WC_8_21_14_2_50_31_20]|nr:MAG: hypothetical protein COW71_08390 [Ignavibacteriales bacterium CG18_big_fil_WC_8_21_14_2_50_31_20]